MGHAWPHVDCKIKLLKRGKNACILSSLNGCTSRTERTQQFRLVVVIRFILIIIKLNHVYFWENSNLLGSSKILIWQKLWKFLFCHFWFPTWIFKILVAEHLRLVFYFVFKWSTIILSPTKSKVGNVACPTNFFTFELLYFNQNLNSST